MNLTPKLLFTGAALALASIHNPAAAEMLKTRVQEGALSGTRHGPVSAFLGVPYAAPPVGELRWKPPQAAQAWSSVRQAKTLPASCQQSVNKAGFGPWTHEYVVSNEVSEDCLYLNVWTPAASADEKLPVMVWIHGGAFNSGSASIPIYDGSNLAAKGMVVIGINYRLSHYGFLAHPELTAESPAGASGNYGLMDQIAALEWIKANAAAFGGDPSRVTIAGQSAGAMSVHNLISSPLAKGLFTQAIAQSGSGMAVNPLPRASAEKTGAALAAAAGVTSIADLRRLSVEQLDAAAGKVPMMGGLPFSPIIDGLVLPDETFADANTNDTPLLTGMTSDEMWGMNPAAGKKPAASVRQAILDSYGRLGSEMLALYPAGSDAEANASDAALSTEKGIASMTLWAETRLRSSRHPVYAYLWSHAEPGPDAKRYRAFHSSEIPYVFGTLDASPERPFTDVDFRLSALLGDYWANWVKTGNPNGPGLPNWPGFEAGDRQILEIGDTVEARPALDPAKLELFRQYAKDGGRMGLF